jgi:periplasmic divalent cation tolerance protein
MSDAWQVVTTAASRDEAERIAQVLLARRLAACVQIGGPIESRYHWQGKLETSQEWQCTIKTRRSFYPAVEAAIREVHSYDVPEILAFEVVAGERQYLDWLAAELPEQGQTNL